MCCWRWARRRRRERVLAATATLPAETRRVPVGAGRGGSALGLTEAAERSFKRVLLAHPLSAEAEIARAKLTAMGAEIEADSWRSCGAWATRITTAGR